MELTSLDSVSSSQPLDQFNIKLKKMSVYQIEF